MNSDITISGARQHNLKNISLTIPRNKLVVVCGPSGSGKSTLAFDIIYAEGQRRYMESLSAYARQFLPQMDKPDVDKIEGLSPAISLEQQTTGRNPRSTVGTTTEIYDFLRVFFARLGKPHCPKCGQAIVSQTSDEIIDRILNFPENSKIILLAPLLERRKGTHAKVLEKLRSQGFVRVRINGEIHALDPMPELAKTKFHTIELVIDRLVIRSDMRKRLADSVELALQFGEGKIIAAIPDGEEIFFSTESACPHCNISLPKISPQLFSFNSPLGACTTCGGLGNEEYFAPELIAPNTGLSLSEGAILPWKRPKTFARYRQRLQKLGEQHGFTLKTPLQDFSKTALHALFFGDSDWLGVLRLLKSGLSFGRIWGGELSRYMQNRPCPTCKGNRLRPEALAIKIDGMDIAEFVSLPIGESLAWIEKRQFTPTQEIIATPLLRELRHRLGFLVSVGLDYINLGRNMSTLSGGEAQRIRLAGQLGSGLVGVTYVLDEPSIGLHPKDNKRLISTLRDLQNRGNTVLVVEHDEPTILNADHIIEMGPGSGYLGGEIVYSGDVSGLLAASSLTGKYLRGELKIESLQQKRRPTGKIVIKGAKANNLQNIDCDFPLGQLVCVTGVSGSGKSSLVMDTLYQHLNLAKGNKAENPGQIDSISGAKQIEKIISIDQTPIGRTPRSNPATYTKIFDDIRKIFAETPQARQRGYKVGRFSFNVRGGRCEACQGDGLKRVEMHFLPDIFVTCDVCHGKRYNRETLDVYYKDKNIADVLEMSVREAKDFFENFPTLKRRLTVLEEVGLEYIRLGQAATTLSGGEAQRIKLSRELGKRSLPGTLYILDEPTTGLHMHEVGKLIQTLQKLVDKEASVIVIEHNLDVIRCADHIIDLGPGGGVHGGQIVAAGNPKEIAANKNSITGKFLQNNL